MLTLDCIKLLLTCSYNSPPTSARLVIPKRSTHTLFSRAHVKPWYGRVATGVVPGVVSHLHTLSGANDAVVWSRRLLCSPPSWVHFPLVLLVPWVKWAGLCIGTAGWPKEGWNEAFQKVCQLQGWDSSTAKSTFPAKLTPALGRAAWTHSGINPDTLLSLALQRFPISLRGEGKA